MDEQGPHSLLRVSARSCPAAGVLRPALTQGVPASTRFAVQGVLKAPAAPHARRCWVLCRAAWPAKPSPSMRLCPRGALWPSACPRASTDSPREVTASQTGWLKNVRGGRHRFPTPEGSPLGHGTAHFVFCLGGKGMRNLNSWCQEGCKNRQSERKTPVIVEQLSSKSQAVDKEPDRQQSIAFPVHMVLQSPYFGSMMLHTDNCGYWCLPRERFIHCVVRIRLGSPGLCLTCPLSTFLHRLSQAPTNTVTR